MDCVYSSSPPVIVSISCTESVCGMNALAWLESNSSSQAPHQQQLALLDDNSATASVKEWSDFLEFCRSCAIAEGYEDRPWLCVCGQPVGTGTPKKAKGRSGHALWIHLEANVGQAGHPLQDDMDRWDSQRIQKAMLEKANTWPQEWFAFLEMCRSAAEKQKKTKPWLCVCGRSIGYGSPCDAGGRSGLSLWSHLQENIGVGNHPGQDDIDRWQLQWQQINAKKTSSKRKKWGTADDLWPYIEKLDRECVEKLMRKMDRMLHD